MECINATNLHRESGQWGTRHLLLVGYPGPLIKRHTSAMIRPMAHIGFLPVHAKGHMYPASSLALHLQQRGHRITFFCIADSATFFQEYGLDCVVVGGKSFPIGYGDQVFEKLGKLKGQAGVLYTMKLFEAADRYALRRTAGSDPSQAGGCIGH